MNEIEYQIVLSVYLPSQGGRMSKQIVRCSDRESAIKKFAYLDKLVNTKTFRNELNDWAQDNLIEPGHITHVDGLFGVAYIKILPQDL